MAVHSTRKEVTTTQLKKLDNLSSEQERPLFHVQDTVKLFDIGIVPPNYIIDTLALGPKNPVLTKFDQKEILAEIHIVLSKLNERNVSNEVINDINVATLQYIKICCKQKTPHNILMTRWFLKEHDLLAVPFDKDINICVMKASTYKEKLGAILQLEQFVKVTNTRKNEKELCFKEEERINEALQNLIETGVLNENLSNEMKSKGGQLPKLYGLAKIHKESVPARPVFSMPGSPYYKLAEKVTKWFSVIPESKINCSTQKAVDQLKNVKLDPEEVIISFDLSSLYTNVPVNEAINDAANLLYLGRYVTPPVDKETFIALTKLAVTDVVLSSHDGCFRQVDGLAMDSQPAPQLANIWLAKFKESIKDDAKIYEKYIDDILRSIKESLVEAKLREINRLQPNLKCTLEVEQDGKLPFLDIWIIHINDELHSKWHQKPSDTGLVMSTWKAKILLRNHQKSVFSCNTGVIKPIYL